MMLFVEGVADGVEVIPDELDADYQPDLSYCNVMVFTCMLKTLRSAKILKICTKFEQNSLDLNAVQIFGPLNKTLKFWKVSLVNICCYQLCFQFWKTSGKTGQHMVQLKHLCS